MKTGIKVPALGESVVEARIAHWLKKEGDPLKVGEIIVELETEKVNVDVAAETSGVLTVISAREDQTVHIGDTIGEIDTEAKVERADAAGEKNQDPKEIEVEKTRSSEEHDRHFKTQSAEAKGTERATPVAKRVAEAVGVKISGVAGSGVRGRVTKHDVEELLNQATLERQKQSSDGGKEKASGNETFQPAQPASPYIRSGEGEERVRMSLRRKTIARRMVEAQQTAAMLTTFNEIDMTRVMQLRRNYKEQFKTRYGANFGIVSFFVKAAISALQEFPRLNAEISGDDIIYKHYYDIGVAIGAAEGLVVPVLRNAETMSFAQIEGAIKGFAEKSSNGTLTMEDLKGGTFTITNGGVFGSMMSTPILNPPQVGILGLHKISDRPVAVDGQVAIRPMMYVALTYDHRIVDGRESVQFLVKVKEYIEDPASMLLV